ncbi:LOG family protein YvdD [Tepidimonas charontis]|uniref:Cytokinin riboside 5'-monophosphate phosphoribohydrolase n=2 Tax=Tepidimonas charontis TaxID=2267262 RepID=A0A554XKS8_9BURK|nr:LOG family protein YvdD [Tepidimonas charontis]
MAERVGAWIGRHGGRLVYGGGQYGLMGRVADATLAAGGTVVGIIPQTLVERECAKRDCTELHIVQTMHQRKQMMAERADAFVVLPGGIGTLEEAFEVWSWRQLGVHDKPIGWLNVDGYYDALLTFLAQTVRAGFVGAAPMNLITVGDNPETLLPQLVQAAGVQAPADWRGI